ncbi:type II toxin-antitoxin system PemK/MazF family toxin [Corynebacterium sp. H128]|uniref:type II toxin-antitoxin system PemK/MazF family toxin n=1 Tax=unclassified Corynebacterium TaxID=2624378 RepID=UPI0030A8B2DF
MAGEEVSTTWSARFRDSLRSFVAARAEARRSRLDRGLDRIGNRLGLQQDPDGTDTERVEAVCNVHPTEQMVRNIYYAPDMDGHAEPGEVVWIKISTDDESAAQDRALLVVGHGLETILGLLISANSDHAKKKGWMDIGSGSWDSSGAPCWLRLDKVIEVPELAIRREGTVVPRRRFERIATKLRTDYHWG